MNEAPTFWETSVHAVRDRQGKQVPLVVSAEPREGDPTHGITVRACLIDNPQNPLMTIKAFVEDGLVEVSNGYLLVNDEHYRRQGIGSICLARAFAWAKHYHAHLTLSRFKIGSQKTGDEAEGLRRLYQAHGMVFHDPRPSGGSWYCDHLKCSQIVIPSSPEPQDKQGRAALDGLLKELRERSVSLSGELVISNDLNASVGRRLRRYRVYLVVAFILCFVLLFKSIAV